MPGCEVHTDYYQWVCDAARREWVPQLIDEAVTYCSGDQVEATKITDCTVEYAIACNTKTTCPPPRTDCPEPTTPCGCPEDTCFGTCTDMSSDRNNCGGCGITCNFVQQCVNGTCQSQIGGGF